MRHSALSVEEYVRSILFPSGDFAVSPSHQSGIDSISTLKRKLLEIFDAQIKVSYSSAAGETVDRGDPKRGQCLQGFRECSDS